VTWSVLLVAAMLQAAPAPTAIETLNRDQSSGVDEARQVVVRSADEWAKVWREHAGDKPAPTVDFAHRMVVAVFLGSRPSAGYAVEIVGTRPDGAGLVVEWRERAPERGTVAAQIMTAPAHLVSVAKVTGTVRFEKAGQ
jgi:hypothetical protein